ncbi:MAG: helix-turn-helix transcriptional regulator [Anaerolineales bacterium]|nr:helix-turn-helix transcriptional regulator [Anaerolineales bacterium]
MALPLYSFGLLSFSFLMESAFVDWVLRELEKRSWSQAELARRSKISESHISHVFFGRRQPQITFCKGIARAFELPPELVLRKAGLLPPIREEAGSQALEWQHIFSQARDDEERRQLLEIAQFEMKRIRKRNP